MSDEKDYHCGKPFLNEAGDGFICLESGVVNYKFAGQCPDCYNEMMSYKAAEDVRKEVTENSFSSANWNMDWAKLKTNMPKVMTKIIKFDRKEMDREASAYDFEDLGKDYPEAPMMLLKLTKEQKEAGLEPKLYKNVEQLISFGTSRAEVVKIMDRCTKEAYLDIDRAIKLTGDKLIDIYLKQKHCPCRAKEGKSLLLVGVDNRCKGCGAFIFFDGNGL